MPRINPYILQQQKVAERLAMAKTIQRVPHELQPRQINSYPEDNKYEFERWLKDNLKPQELISKERVYLPILWTGYWCNNGYGTKDKAKRIIQRFIDSLPRNKKYFSVVQYDDGPMVDFKDLDIKIFGMSGGRIDYPIPLLCQPHKYEFSGIQKDIFCSFVGGDTHPIRRELVKEFQGKKNCIVKISKIGLEEYCNLMARSVFSLCPRGYGKSSFRLQESLQQHSIPIYISDEFINPYNDESLIRIRVLNNSVTGLHDYLRNIENPYITANMEGIRHLFTYEGCKKMILENI